MNQKHQIFYIVSVLVMAKGYNAPVYYVTTNVGVSIYVGFCNLPDMVKTWLEKRNSFDYVHTVLNTNECSILLISDLVVT